jgi:trimeric autotransporter adhesin
MPRFHSNTGNPLVSRLVLLPLVALLLAGWVAAPAPARAAPAELPRADLWVPNSSVSAAVVDGDTLYIGGGFTMVGPSTGNSALIDPASGAPDLSWPKVAGQVFSIVDDGSGGWFIGGFFSAVDGEPRQRLAHILADGTLDPSWNPGVDSTVWTMLRDGDTLYIGGEFSTVEGVGRNGLAALSVADGSLDAGWNPAPSAYASIVALALDGMDLYVGGEFTAIGGENILRLARVSTATGDADASWAPAPDSMVRTLLVSGGTLYVGGQFSTISGVPRQRLAALSTSAGATAMAWTPDPNNNVWTLALDGDTLYVGGSYTTIASNARGSLASFDIGGGAPALTSWNPGANALVMDLTVAGNRLYVAGSFTAFEETIRRHLASFDLTDDPPTLTSWDPVASDQARAVATTTGGQVLAGGDFTSIGGVVRNRLAAIDLTTGAPTDWAPDLNAVAITMKQSGTTLYVGGYFTSIDGQTRNRLAAFDTTTGDLLPWAPSVENGSSGTYVGTLEADGALVYAGGSFGTSGGVTRNNLAAFDATSGALDSFDPNPNQPVDTISLHDGVLYVTGFFSTIGGATRDKLAAFDASSGALTGWNPGIPGGSASDILATDDAVYVAGSFSTIGGQARANLAALDPTTGAPNSWNPNVTGHVNSVALVDGRIYIGGSFTEVDGEERERLAEIDPAATATGSYLLGWDPGANSVVNVVVPAGPHVYVAGSFYRIANRAASFSALFGPALPYACACLATDITATSATLNGIVNANGSETMVSFEWGTTAGGPYPNTAPAAESPVAGSADEPVSVGISGLAPETTYYYRVVATNAGGTVTSSEASLTTGALGSGTAPQITSAPSTEAGIGREYRYTVAATGSPAPTFSIDGIAPAGMTIDPASGTISWTPTEAGDYSVTVRAANGVLSEATQTFTIAVRHQLLLPMTGR